MTCRVNRSVCGVSVRCVVAQNPDVCGSAYTCARTHVHCTIAELLMMLMAAATAAAADEAMASTSASASASTLAVAVQPTAKLLVVYVCVFVHGFVHTQVEWWEVCTHAHAFK